MRNRVGLILKGLCKIHEEGFEVKTRSDSYWQLFLVVVLNFYDIPEGKYMSVGRNRSIPTWPCIWLLDLCEALGGLQYFRWQEVQRTLRARRNTRKWVGTFMMEKNIVKCEKIGKDV